MATGAPWAIPMTDVAQAGDLLRLTQWLSPAFPLGAFAYSHGLEQFIARGEITNAAALQLWLSDILRAGAGRSDGILLSLAHRGALPDEDLADLAAALAPSRERWEESIAQGRAFGKTSNAILGSQLCEAALPVVVGIQARCLSLSTPTVLALYLQSFLGNLVSVATRAVPLGQTEAQIVLDRLGSEIAAQASNLALAEPQDLASAVPRADLMAMAHETQEIRIYRS
ncbi:MAG: urease accessory protein UreF [Mangrovicoccus sp.]|nr:urease accessory protein UreF [Mangrovicoccus sp.]